MGNQQPRQPRKPRFQREERRELRTQLSIIMAQFFSWAVWLVPPLLRYWIADRAGDAFLRYSHTYSTNVADNIQHVIDGAVAPEELSRLQHSIFRTSARNFTDLLTMPRQSRAKLKRSVAATTGSWEMLDEAVKDSRGLLIVTGHVGCFDFIGHAFWSRGYDTSVITGRTTSRFIFDGVTHLRAGKRQRMVQATPSGVREVIRLLRTGGNVVVLADRDFFQNGRKVTFFGEETTLPPGAVRMARDTGSQILTVIPKRLGHGKHELVINDPFTVPKTSDIAADLDAGMKMVVSQLEEGISANLDQWAMFQRVWPDEPADPVQIFPVGSPLQSELLEKVAQALPELPPPGERLPILGRRSDRFSTADEGTESSDS